MGARNLLDQISVTATGGPIPFTDQIGSGTVFQVEGESGPIRQSLTVRRYDSLPEAVCLEYAFENTGQEAVEIEKLACPQVSLSGWARAELDGTPLWSFQGAAVYWGHDFAFPLLPDWQRDNYLGHVDNGEGGGLPLLYFWKPERGLALMHIEPEPQDWYLPVATHGGQVQAALEDRAPITLRPGERMAGLRIAISVHQGDFYAPLALYARLMAARGLAPAQFNREDYEPAWCSWGYEEDVRPEEVTGALPKCTQLGIRWLTLDDRWFDHYGDYNPRPDTFPGGERQMRSMVEEIHAAGAYAQIWWYPLAVENEGGAYGHLTYAVSKVLQEHPGWLILNPDGSMACNNRGLGMLDPSLPEVQAYIRELNRRFIQEWDFDGHKLDNIYTVPACYNPAHHHKDPRESTRALAEIYRIIYEDTRSLKPYSVTQICPCGTTPTFTLLPWMDQAVTADPTSSLQIRQRIKFYKALLGPRAPVFADHVELADGGDDFASEIGAGGIPATKFVWPEDEQIHARLEEYWALTPGKEEVWRKWLAIYRQHRLAEGEYLNLYDLAFDVPETHVIARENRLYYAFFPSKPGESFSGTVELRGLAGGAYRVVDYVQQRELGVVSSREPYLQVAFDGSLLVAAVPVFD